MKELVFQVEFLSDIVLPATSNNEGNIEQLDFIPGSNFLGMVAANGAYEKFEESFKVFHSGDVKFGDATLLKDDKPTYKMPLSYFHEKLNDKELFNHHHIKDFSRLKQPKQKRNGHITVNKELVEIEYNYSQKSAYDKNKRRSKDSSMYGYSAIPKGTKWKFSVKYNQLTDNDLEFIEKLEGTQRLGKSKSAQYGLIEIKKTQVKEFEININKHNGEVVLYVNSRLALIDKCGNPTYDLKYLFDGLEDTNIDYAKSQIKTSTFTPYNGARQTKDYERVCINKGSVIVLKELSNISIPNFVGAYQSEGFGEILINPSFLNNQDSFRLVVDCKDENKLNQRKKLTQTFEDTTVQFLVNRHNASIDKLELANEVADFIEKNKQYSKKKMNSQWGTIRSFTLRARTQKELYDLIFDKNPIDKPKGYLRGKKAKEKWNSTLIDNFEKMFSVCNNKEFDFIKFTKLLSMQMPKIKENKEQTND